LIQRLLIANRSEIAIRIARGAREMGITPLGVFSEADRSAMHLDYMEDAVCIGPAAASDSYLNMEAVIAAAAALRADSIHPGYGFLSERAAFAQAAGDAGLIFVGPSPQAMAAMGSKREAKTRVRAFDVPVIPGYEGEEQDPKSLRKEAERIGTPLLIKASAGGGGRGMRVVERMEQFDEALQAAQREAKSAFGDATVLLERYLKGPRHIEFQVLADAHGNTIHVGERECSIQRRHQKIIEEAPSVAVSPELRGTMGAAAVRAAKSVDYVNAGTVEFMLDQTGKFYFLEMNTRLQVEHPVTEMAYGLDLVHWQLRIANGERLTVSQDSLEPRWWAIESRIYAEDPSNQMLPSTGTITRWEPPQALGVRLDSGVRRGSQVSVYYDPMLAKLIVFGPDRATAIARMADALREFAVGGVRTNIPLLEAIFNDPQFRAGETTTQFLEEWLTTHSFERGRLNSDQLCAAVANKVQNSAPFRIGSVGLPFYLTDGQAEYALTASRSGERWQIRGDAHGEIPVGPTGRSATSDVTFAPPPDLERTSRGGPAHSGRILSPMPGKIVKVSVMAGDSVGERALLMVLEAMKMEHRIEAPSAGAVRALHVKEGDIVTGAAPLVDLE